MTHVNDNVKDDLKAFSKHYRMILNFPDSKALVRYQYNILNVIFAGLPEEEQEKLIEVMLALDKRVQD